MNVNRMTRNQRRLYKKKLLEQRLMGLGLLACCGVQLWMCSTGTTMADRDGTAVVLLAPLALYMLFTKEIVIV